MSKQQAKWRNGKLPANRFAGKKLSLCSCFFTRRTIFLGYLFFLNFLRWVVFYWYYPKLSGISCVYTFCVHHVETCFTPNWDLGGLHFFSAIFFSSYFFCFVFKWFFEIFGFFLTIFDIFFIFWFLLGIFEFFFWFFGFFEFFLIFKIFRIFGFVCIFWFFWFF